jgi:hypothetical protein
MMILILFLHSGGNSKHYIYIYIYIHTKICLLPYSLSPPTDIDTKVHLASNPLLVILSILGYDVYTVANIKRALL